MLMTQSLPRRMKVKGVRGDKEVGVTCISYHTEDKDMFLVGSEAGVIFKCSMNSQGPPAGSKAFWCLGFEMMYIYFNQLRMNFLVCCSISSYT